MARFVNMENDKEIIDFNNMTVKQFRYLVRKAIEINKEEDMKFDENDIPYSAMDFMHKIEYL